MPISLDRLGWRSHLFLTAGLHGAENNARNEDEDDIVIEQWRQHYNTVRPHSALGYRPPAPESIIPMDQLPTMH